MNNSIRIVFFVFFLFFFSNMQENAYCNSNSNVIFNKTVHFTACMEKLGCTEGGPWGYCKEKKYSYNNDQAFKLCSKHIIFKVNVPCKVIRKLTPIKKCFNGCDAWFDVFYNGKWQYVGNTLWSAKPGKYRLVVVSDGYKGCGIPYKQISYCPSSSTVKILVFPFDKSVNVPDAVSVISDSNTHTNNSNNVLNIYSLTSTMWQPHTTSEGKCFISSERLCINSMQPGGAWFTTIRPYKFDKNYTVEFDVKLNTAKNHFPILYSDGFVYINIDWGTDLGYYQPGAAYGVKNHLVNLKVGVWHKIKVEAFPLKKSFKLYLDGMLLSTATNIQLFHNYHTLSPQINSNEVIWFGDADSINYRGGTYNCGSVCWKNINVKQN